MKICNGRFGNSDAHYWRFLPHCGHALCYRPAFGKVFLRLQVSDVSESESERFFRLSKVKWLICGGWVGCCDVTPTNFSSFDSFSSKFGNIIFTCEKMAGLAYWSYLNFYFKFSALKISKFECHALHIKKIKWHKFGGPAFIIDFQSPFLLELRIFHTFIRS